MRYSYEYKMKCIEMYREVRCTEKEDGQKHQRVLKIPSTFMI